MLFMKLGLLVILGILAVIVISGCTSQPSLDTSQSNLNGSNSDLTPIPSHVSTLSCEAQYNDMIKDIEDSNYCSGKCFSLPLMGMKDFTDRDLPECYYFVSKDARGKYVSLDAVNLKIIRFMSDCKDEFSKYMDKCSSRPQVTCSNGRCVSYFD